MNQAHVSTDRTTVELPSDLMQELRHMAVAQRTSIKNVLYSAVDTYVKKNRSRQKQSFAKVWEKMQAFSKYNKGVNLTEMLMKERDKRYEDPYL